jgi:hypothetical protein
MIVFDLQCSDDHVFEGWFEDGKAFDDQKKKNLISCPVCNDTNVFKKLSTFGLAKQSSNNNVRDIATRQEILAGIGEKIIDYVKNNFDDVGCDFAKEALKIHYGVSEPRNIKGISTKEEEKQLKEEGIPILKIPIPVDQDPDA